jgi:predicted RNase H-like nuclease (RuvC/YqgF family)
MSIKCDKLRRENLRLKAKIRGLKATIEALEAELEKINEHG